MLAQDHLIFALDRFSTGAGQPLVNLGSFCTGAAHQGVLDYRILIVIDPKPL